MKAGEIAEQIFLALLVICAIGILVLGIYMAVMNPTDSECEQKGGVMIKSNNRYLCVKLEVIK